MTSIRRYTDEPLFVIFDGIRRRLALMEPGAVLDIEVPNPDASTQHYPGELIQIHSVSCRHRPLKVWTELAETVGCVLQTPTSLDDGFVRLSFRLLDRTAAWHRGAAPSGHPEKYGEGSGFDRMDKFEDPVFLARFESALDFCGLPESARILSVGVNRGAEFIIFEALLGAPAIQQMHFVGLDHSTTAIKAAQIALPAENITLKVADIRRLVDLELGRFDLIMAINTLHSPGLDGHGILRQLVTNHLHPGGSILIGYPNDHFVDYQQIYGGQVKNYHDPEMSHLLKDVMAHRRYLHQQGFVVKVSGKHTVVLVARRLPC